MAIKTVTIIGMGLIGGSMAKALRRVDSIKSIIGIDTDMESLNTALSDGVLDKAYTCIDKNINSSDIVFICTPTNKTADCLKEVIKVVNTNCIITDTGSIKSCIIHQVENINGQFEFIGGHPMCGSEKSGYTASKGHLFENAYYILTPCAKTSDNAVNIMQKIINQVGGLPIVLNSKEHDNITGAISHTPHIISAALVNMIKELDSEEGYMRKLAAGGFKDITRISSSKPDMWENIVINNKTYIRSILKKFLEKINHIISWLDTSSVKEIHEFFYSAKEYRDTFASNNGGLIAPFYDMMVDIEDKPGEIGKLTTLLGTNYINIININVLNSREDDHGCLKITFSSKDSLDRAYNLLKLNGYTAYKN